jgi:hypothetical protein
VQSSITTENALTDDDLRQQTQPTTLNGPSRRTNSPDLAPSKSIPRLVERPTDAARRGSNTESNESELPPTPVQLGLDAQPDRPRGLSSSSPRGSRTSTRRKRQRGLDGRVVTSSPLKPRANGPLINDMESQPDEIEEAGGNSAEEQAVDPNSEDLPEELREKTQALRNLQMELVKLKADTTEVELALGTNDLTNISPGSSLVEIFKSTCQPANSHNTEFEQASSTERSETLYRSLFNSGNLQLHSKTVTKLVKGHAKVVHQLSLTPPYPWHSALFSANFEVVTDAEEILVEKVTWIDAMAGRRRAPGIQDEMQTWIQERLRSELHGLDVGGIVWALGQYFVSSVERATTFQTLASKFKVTNDTFAIDDESEGDPAAGDEQARNDDKSTEAAALRISRYLSVSQITLEGNTDDSAMTTRRIKSATPKIIVVWRIEPTWTGSMKSICEIAPTGIPDSAQQSVKELFDRVKLVSGVENAVEGVWEMMSHLKGKRGTLEEGQTNGVPPKKKKRFS